MESAKGECGEEICRPQSLVRRQTSLLSVGLESVQQDMYRKQHIL